jgi:hypothetical protein
MSAFSASSLAPAASRSRCTHTSRSWPHAIVRGGVMVYLEDRVSGLYAMMAVLGSREEGREGECAGRTATSMTTCG